MGGPLACLSQAFCSHPSGVACDEGLGLTNRWAPVPFSPLHEPGSQTPLGSQLYILFTKRIAWPPRAYEEAGRLSPTWEELVVRDWRPWWDAQGLGGSLRVWGAWVGVTTALGFSDEPSCLERVTEGTQCGLGKTSQTGRPGPESWASRQLSLGLGFPIGNTGELDETGNAEVRGPVDEGPAAT